MIKNVSPPVEKLYSAAAFILALLNTESFDEDAFATPAEFSGEGDEDDRGASAVKKTKPSARKKHIPNLERAEVIKPTVA
jgi:hypothetical protein